MSIAFDAPVPWDSPLYTFDGVSLISPNEGKVIRQEPRSTVIQQPVRSTIIRTEPRSTIIRGGAG